MTKFRKEFKDLRDRFAALKKDQAAQVSRRHPTLAEVISPAVDPLGYVARLDNPS